MTTMTNVIKAEIFKDVNEYPNYQISNYGRVLNKKRNSFLNGTVNSNGYVKVKLSRKNIDDSTTTKTFAVHRLVALHFIPNPENKKEVNHIDAIKTNNHIDNLEWCTSRENVIHALELGLNSKLNFINNDELIGKIRYTKTNQLPYIVDRLHEVKDEKYYFVIRFLDSNNEKVCVKGNILRNNIGDFMYFINDEYYNSDNFRLEVAKLGLVYKTIMQSISRKGSYQKDNIIIRKAINYKIQEAI